MYKPGKVAAVLGVEEVEKLTDVKPGAINFPVKTDPCYKQKFAAYNTGT